MPCVVRAKKYPMASNEKNVLSLVFGFLQGKSHDINGVKSDEYEEKLAGNNPECLFGDFRRDYRVNHSRLALCAKPHTAISDTLAEHISVHLFNQDKLKKNYNSTKAKAVIILVRTDGIPVN